MTVQHMTAADLRKAASAVYLATEAGPAEDISRRLRWAADEIERLRAAERQALAITDDLRLEILERAKENVALQAALRHAEIALQGVICSSEPRRARPLATSVRAETRREVAVRISRASNAP